ncbi:MAG: TdeIII family type II restriction endonuclease [Anaerolineales bacterium]|nr:TdeIII family type II restriction endonuclease [Anaerolineales bacterium]
MGMSTEQKEKIKKVLKESLRNKFKSYNPETKNMPFHYRLLGKDRMALYSFIQSLNTTFGTSIYEPVAVSLAEERFKSAKAQVKPFGLISETAQNEIQHIMDGLITGVNDPNKPNEISRLRKVCNTGKMNNVKLTKIDILLEKHNGEMIFIDMKTVKPNIGGFKEFKRTLLEWAAAEMTRNPTVQIKTMLGFPYNPYEPEPYNRWTMKGLFDLPEEILIAEELWDFIGGEGTYRDLLDCFEIVGIELRPEIDQYFAGFK